MNGFIKNIRSYKESTKLFTYCNLRNKQDLYDQ